MSASKNLIQAAAGVGGGGFYPYTVDNSIRMAAGSTDYLTFTPSTNGNNTTFTLRFMVKRSGLGAQQWLFLTNNSYASSYTGVRLNVNDTLEYFNIVGGSVPAQMVTSSFFRDVSSWYDIVISVSSTNIDMYVNGVEQPYGTINQPNGESTGVNRAGNLMSTSFVSGISGGSLDGYLAEMVLVDGQALTPTSFGEFKNGIWVPKNCSALSFGTNGAYLKFGNSGALGTDSSGNSNNWTVNGLTSADQMIDTPTNNFPTWNSLIPSTVTYSEGNIKALPTGVNHSTLATQGFSSGKYYWECRLDSQAGAGYSPIGVTNYGSATTWYSTSFAVWTYINQTGGTSPGGTTTSSSGSVVYHYDNSGTYTAGQIIMCAVDIDAGKIWWGVDGTWIDDISGNVGNPSTGANARYSDLSGTIYPIVGQSMSSGSSGWNANFGQNGTFNGLETAQGNTDENGIGDFYYAPPTGFLSLCTANLPEPTIGPNIDENSSGTTSDENFNTVLYVGNGTAIGSGGKSVTGVGFQPDMVWTKNRDAAQSWAWMDTQIGTGKYWTHNYTSTGVITNSESLASMDSDGFTVGNLANANVNGQAYVAYCFKKVAGVFDTVGYSGTGSVQNISHNLGAVPKVIIVKRVINANTAPSYFDGGQVSDPQTDFIGLFDTVTFIDSTIWNDTAPTSTQFTVGTSSGVNLSSDTYVAYLFADVEGFSSFGSYTGNGSTDGPFIYTGFRPAYLVIKRTDAASSWYVQDSARTPYNLNTNTLFLDLNQAENSAELESTYGRDMLSNGFKIRASHSTHNASGGTYIYMAFAENPFKYSNAR